MSRYDQYKLQPTHTISVTKVENSSSSPSPNLIPTSSSFSSYSYSASSLFPSSSTSGNCTIGASARLN